MPITVRVIPSKGKPIPVMVEPADWQQYLEH